MNIPRIATSAAFAALALCGCESAGDLGRLVGGSSFLFDTGSRRRSRRSEARLLAAR